MGNHRNTASRIWRTIVCSGAMLGVPLGAAAGDAPPQKQAPAKPAPPPAKPALPPTTAVAAELEREAADAKTKLDAAQLQQATLAEAVKLARSTTDTQDLTARATAQVQNGKSEAQRAGARLVLQRLAPALPTSEQDLVTRINQAIEEVANAQSDADRTAARNKLAALQKELEAKRAAARPRATNRERPLGRGFILS